MARDCHVAAIPTTISTPSRSSEKKRPHALQLVSALVLILMIVVVVYMYSIIDTLHKQQQAMRMQIDELRGTSYASAAEPSAPLRPEFLPSKRYKPQDDEDIETETQMNLRSPNVVEMLTEPQQAGKTTLKPRKLEAMRTIGTGQFVGCYALTDTATENYDVSGTNCNSNNCPDCFVTPATVSQDIALTVTSCSGAKWIRGVARDGIWVYTFINTHATYTLSVTDNSASPVTYNIPPGSFVQAYCQGPTTTYGVQNKLFFPSHRLPTLAVDSAITMSAGNFDASSSSGTFQTSTGANSLNGDTEVTSTKTFTTGTGTVSLKGATTVADSTTLTVGSSGSGGQTTLYGDLQVGSATNNHAVATTLYGDFTQNDDSNTGLAAKTFNTATGGVYLNGHTTIATGKNLHMVETGAGTFQTGTGTVTFYGDSTVHGSKTFTSGTGTVSLLGHTTVADSMNLNVGSSGAGGQTTLYGAVQIGSSTSGHSASTNMYGSFTQHDDASGSAPSSFTSGTNTVTLNGHTTIASDKNLHQASGSTGTFQTGTGSVTLNGDTTISADKFLSTGTGAVSLNGATAVADNKPFSVGTAGNGGATQFHGTVRVGGNTDGTSTSLDVYGDVTFHNDNLGTTKTFTTATGAISLMGDVTIGANNDLIMQDTGTGQFSTGTGTISLNGDTTVKNSATFTLAAYSSQVVCSHDNSDPTANYCKASR